MIIIQILLIVAVIGVGVYAVTKRNTHSGSAWQKIAVFLFLAFAVLAVIWPGITQRIADVVGVGRGTDLLLYASIVTLLFLIFNLYLTRQEQRDTQNRLARRVALLEAQLRYLGDDVAQGEPERDSID